MAEYSKIEPLSHKYNDQSSEQDDAEDSYLEEVHFRQPRISTLRWLRQEARTITLHTLFLLFNVAALMAYASGWLTLRSFPDPHDKSKVLEIMAFEETNVADQTHHSTLSACNSVRGAAFCTPVDIFGESHGEPGQG